MEIAYIVLAHTDPELFRMQSERLVQSGDVYIHINKKVDITPFFNVMNKEVLNDKVFFINNRISVNWAGFSIVQATFETMRMCLKQKKYDRIVLLTGQDYPIKAPNAIVDFFKNNSEKEFVTGGLCTSKEMPSLRRYMYRDNIFKGAILRTIEHFFPSKCLNLRNDYFYYDNKKINFYGISPKWAITGYTAEQLLCFYDTHLKVNNEFSSRHAPDDIYVPTIIRLILENHDSISTDKIFEQLTTYNGVSCSTLTMEHYEVLQQSNALFARKFSSNGSKDLICNLIKI